MNLVKSTLSEQLYELIRNDIITQQIPMGEKITLKQLQEKYDVSSTPVREALTRLGNEGLVSIITNVGVNVISLDRNDLVELYEFMGDLDSLAVSYSQHSEQKAKLIEQLEQSILITSDPARPLEEKIKSSDHFHLFFYDYANNKRLSNAAEKLRSQLTIFSNRYERDPQILMDIDEVHKEILTFYKMEDYESAAKAMKAHLGKSLAYALGSFEG